MAQKYGIGFVLYKSFHGSQYRGVIESFDSDEGFYKIRYDDDDEEELDERDIDVLLRQEAKLLPPAPPPIPVPPMSWSKGQMLQTRASFQHQEVSPMPKVKLKYLPQPRLSSLGHVRTSPQPRLSSLGQVNTSPQPRPSSLGQVQTSHFPIVSARRPAVRIPSNYTSCSIRQASSR